MSSAVTADASVFVNAFSPDEEGSDESAEFLSQLRKDGVPLVQPTLFFPEVVASITRKQDDAEVALELAYELKEFSRLTLIDLDILLIMQARWLRNIVCAAVTRSMRRSLCGLERN